MNALLLAAGMGTRLRPFTFFRAKSTLPLFDVPFLHYPLHFLRANGVNHTVINLHAHPESVRNAAGDNYHGMEISYSHEPEILGTAGAIWKAAPTLGSQPIIVMNSDMLCDVPLQDVYARHCSRGDLVTLVIMRDERFARYNGLQFEEGDPPIMTGVGGAYHYTGLQIVSPEILQHIPPARKSEIFQDVYPQLLATGRITGYIYDGLWMEIGNLEQYLETSLALRDHELPGHLRPVGMGHSMISTEAKIEPGAIIDDSIVMSGATVKTGVHVKYSIVGWDVTVNSDTSTAALARGITRWWIRKK